MIKEIIMKVGNRESLTDIEANEFLKYFCGVIREKCGIVDSMDDNCKVCYETSMMFGRLMLLQFNCDVESLNIKKIFGIPLTHFANLIFLNVNGDEKAYLVDMTYSQFFGEKIVLDDVDGKKGKSVSSERVFGRIQEDNFVKELRQKGFVELNEEILIKYVDCFLDICGVSNKIEAYKKLQELLINRKTEFNYDQSVEGTVKR